MVYIGLLPVIVQVFVFVLFDLFLGFFLFRYSLNRFMFLLALFLVLGITVFLVLFRAVDAQLLLRRTVVFAELDAAFTTKVQLLNVFPTDPAFRHV